MFGPKTKQTGKENYLQMWANRLTDRSRFFMSNKMSAINRGALNDFINGLSRLKDEGKLNDEEFSNLLTFACSVFIENELEMRIGRVLTNKTSRIFDRFGLNYD